jgi:hypothetical protein
MKSLCESPADSPVIVTALSLETLIVPGVGSEKATVGGDKYPDPPLVMLTEVTTPPVKTAVAAAPVPLPPENVTVGGDE